MSIVNSFCAAASLPLKKFENESSRALTRRTAGPSLRPASFDKSRVIFFSRTGSRYCSEASECSAPPADSVAVTDLNPVPRSGTKISTRDARPSAPASGVTLICGGSDSKRGRRKYAAVARPPMTISKRTARVGNLRDRSGWKLIWDSGRTEGEAASILPVRAQFGCPAAPARKPTLNRGRLGFRGGGLRRGEVLHVIGFHRMFRADPGRAGEADGENDGIDSVSGRQLELFEFVHELIGPGEV